MNIDRYLFIPKISLKPDRVTLYNEVLIRNYEKNTLDNLPKIRSLKAVSENSETKTIEKKFHNFKISKSGQKTIQEKINWLYILAKSRYKKTYSGVEIFNFKINFLTLTLPSSQVHNTAKITNECFNQFLTEIRERTKMENYVWRLEFQQNGNLHYHIATDTYIDYFFALKIWNRIINKLNYVDKYQEKFSKMNLQEYINNSNRYDKKAFDILAKRYAKGKKENWKNPPTVDVKVCTNNKAIAHYISKYFGKSKENATICNKLDTIDNSFSLRLWFCSRSLSNLKSITEYQEIIKIDWFDMIKNLDKVRTVVCDYATCLFFSIKDLPNYCKGLLYQEFRNYANEFGYNSA